jgi:hypothetical protein
MGGDAEERILRSCLDLEWRALLHLYSEIQREAPDRTALPALALREKARGDALPEATIPLLIACLVDAEPTETVANLAKALAAFGRRAEAAAPYIVERLRSLPVTDDAAFWAYDGCLHALGYVSGPSELPFLDQLAGLSRPPVCPRGVYTGDIPEDDRGRLFADTLERVRALLQREDDGGWTGKNTGRAAAPVRGPSKRGFWTVR